MNKLAVTLLVGSLGLLVYGSYLLHPAAAFLVAGAGLGGFGVMLLDTDGPVR